MRRYVSCVFRSSRWRARYWWLKHTCLALTTFRLVEVYWTLSSLPAIWQLYHDYQNYVGSLLHKQELLTLTEHQGSPPVFSSVRVTRSFVFCVMFCRSLSSVICFSLGHCVACPSSIFGFWLLLWYLQTLHI